ncbi:MAG: DMT family transporter [Rhodospirillaceae bacterium]
MSKTVSSRSQKITDNLRGILWMSLASSLVAVAAISIRQLSAEYTAFQLVFLRSVFGTLLLGPWIAKSARTGTLISARMPMYIFRTGLSYSGMVCVFYALSQIQIGEVYSLLFIVPIITVLMAVFFLKEAAEFHTWLACGIAFIGTLIILQPGALSFNIASTAVLYTAFAYAATNICIKSLSRTDDPVQITIYGNLLSLFVATVVVIIRGDNWDNLSWDDIPWIVGLAVCYLFAGLFHTRSVAAAEARVVQPFNFLRLPVGVLLAWWLFEELPSLSTWLGALLIFGSSYYVLWREGHQRSKR